MTNFCISCERYYFGSYGAHWRFAHHKREDESEGESWGIMSAIAPMKPFVNITSY